MSATHDGSRTDTVRPSLVSRQLLVRYLRLDEVKLLRSLQGDGISVFPDVPPLFVDT